MAIAIILTILALAVIGLVVFHKRRKKADAARKAKAELLSKTSYDVRTPMNAMTGFITIAKKNIDDREKVLDCLDKIELSGLQLLSLIGNVLDTARIEVGFPESNGNAAGTGEASDSQARPDYSGKRVLLVEDNEMNREIARFILEEKGLTVEEASDGDIAVEMVMNGVNYFGRDYYDCIFMDIEMPHLNGYKATAKIREVYDYESVHIPIIAISAHAFEEDRQKSIQEGMDAHIAKPIDMDELDKVLNRFLK